MSYGYREGVHPADGDGRRAHHRLGAIRCSPPEGAERAPADVPRALRPPRAAVSQHSRPSLRLPERAPRQTRSRICSTECSSPAPSCISPARPVTARRRCAACCCTGSRTGVDVALIVKPVLTPEELLITVCDELGVQCEDDAPTRTMLVAALERHLLAAHARDAADGPDRRRRSGRGRRRARTAPRARGPRDRESEAPAGHPGRAAGASCHRRITSRRTTCCPSPSPRRARTCATGWRWPAPPGRSSSPERSRTSIACRAACRESSTSSATAPCSARTAGGWPR